MGIIISDTKFRWPNGIMPFEIDDDAFPAGSTNRATIQAAIDHWNQNTLIRLRPRTNEEDYVHFVPATGSCSSAIGRQGGRQNIGCDLSSFSTGSIIHEIGHAVGLLHEHVREDRDRFVTIHFNNIQDDDQHNFQQSNDTAEDVGHYDYGSIMHYSERSTGFAIDPTQNTLSAPKPVGQRRALSGIDINTVGQAYANAIRLKHERIFGVYLKSVRKDKPEIQIHGWKYADYRAKYDQLWLQNWRLKELTPYVINNNVCYSAIWHRYSRPISEIQVYGWKYADYRAKYDELWPLGWRLFRLKTYVLRGKLHYTAVWRKSKRPEIQVYGWKYADYRTKYDELWPQGWRLKLLQPYSFKGKIFYNAVWVKHRRYRAEVQVYGWQQKDFIHKHREMRRNGFRLSLLQPYRHNGHLLYTAVWDRMPVRSQTYAINLQYDDYNAHYNRRWPQGWRLHSLTTL